MALHGKLIKHLSYLNGSCPRKHFLNTNWYWHKFILLIKLFLLIRMKSSPQVLEHLVLKLAQYLEHQRYSKNSEKRIKLQTSKIGKEKIRKTVSKRQTERISSMAQLMVLSVDETLRKRLNERWGLDLVTSSLWATLVGTSQWKFHKVWLWWEGRKKGVILNRTSGKGKWFCVCLKENVFNKKSLKCLNILRRSMAQ